MSYTKLIHMNGEIRSIIDNLKEVLSGNPWYGKSALTLFNEIDPALVFQKPNDQSHSQIELLFHMLTWTEFTQHRLMKDQQMDAETGGSAGLACHKPGNTYLGKRRSAIY